ncbi:hypothetical protein [Primorskyibacter sp. S87]
MSDNVHYLPGCEPKQTRPPSIWPGVAVAVVCGLVSFAVVSVLVG